MIAPGAVSTTGEYKVKQGDVTQVHVLGLTPFPDAMAKPAREPVTDQTSGEYSIDELKEPLFSIPNDGPHGDWVEILMALHHATGGSKDRLTLARGWPVGYSGYSGYSAKEVADKWRSFGRKGRGQITAEYLLGDEPDSDELPYLTPGQCADLPARDHMAEQVLAFTGPRIGRRIVAGKGFGGFHRPALAWSKTRRARLAVLGVDGLKLSIHQRLIQPG